MRTTNHLISKSSKHSKSKNSEYRSTHSAEYCEWCLEDASQVLRQEGHGKEYQAVDTRQDFC